MKLRKTNLMCVIYENKRNRSAAFSLFNTPLSLLSPINPILERASKTIINAP